VWGGSAGHAPRRSNDDGRSLNRVDHAIVGTEVAKSNGATPGQRRGACYAAWMLLILLTVVGCTGSDDEQDTGGAASPNPPSGRTGLAEPCPDGVTVALGAPFRGRDYAKFQAAGGTVYVRVGRFSDGGDAAAGQATIYIGALARPPTFDPRSSRLRGAIATTEAIGNTWSAIDLAEGRYWLTAANGWDIVIRSCEPGGVSDAATWTSSHLARSVDGGYVPAAVVIR